MTALRRPPWVASVLILLVASYAVYRALVWIGDFGSDSRAAGWLLPGLSLALVVLVLGLAGTLIRNLVKLVVERKRGIFGSRLRAKLVLFFFALVLVPSFVLFYGSAQVIRRTVEAILRTPLEQLTGGDEVVDQWTGVFESQSLRRARALAAEIEERGLLGGGGGAGLAALLERDLRREELLLARVVANGRVIAAAESALDVDPAAARNDRVGQLAAEALAGAAPVTALVRLGDRLVAEAAVPLWSGPARADAPVAVLVVSMSLPQSIARSATTIDDAVDGYQQFRLRRRELVRFFLTLIGLIFLATLFVAMWIGFYLARRITEPIQQVAAAAREVSAGNLSVRVRSSVGDESSVLVDSFNEMAAELQENREVITRSTADLRRSNRALDDRRRYIETLVENLSTAIVSLDPAGRLTTANPAAQRVLGLKLSLGQDVRAELRRHGLGALAELIDRAAAADTVRRHIELPLSAPTQHVAVQVAALRGGAGENLGSLMMVEDLSDLLRAQKAQAWQEVARRIAHEIKNPLTPIQLAAQRLRRKYDARADDLGPVLVESTAAIEREVAGLKQLVDEFSRYARMPDVRPEPVAVGELVQSVLGLYKGLPEVRWTVALDAQLSHVRMDARQMRRALINLVDNAVAALEGRGEIRISTRRGAREGSLCIEVADDGPGIAAADRDKMFMPYFSTKKRGTGLGLAIVHKVVTEHQGTIRIEDNVPRGARFVIEIPA